MNEFVLITWIGGGVTKNGRRGGFRGRGSGRGGFGREQRVRRIDRAAAKHARVPEEDDGEEEGGDPFDESDETPPPPARKAKSVQEVKPAKSILKKPPPPPSSSSGDEAAPEDDDSDAASDDSFEVSQAAAKAGLADDDDEIAALERKLGIKAKNRTKDVGDDELDWLVTGSESEDDGRAAKGKRKREEKSGGDDEWLEAKRRRANAKVPVEVEEEEDGMDGSGDGSEDDGDEDEDLANPFSADEASGDDFAGFDSEADEEPPPKRERENPYVAPVAKSAAPAGKYIPPSLRKAAASDEEALKQLRRQLQGLLNRLSEANMLSILQNVEEVYEKNARQHVTSTMVDLLVSLVSDPSTLNDTFLILHAGFATAMYKVVGTDFGAQLLEQIINSIDKSRAEGTGEGKQMLNLIGFLSNLYTLQMTGSAIIFDYIRIFLSSLSEPHTELLLRIIRTSGTQLRSDDPTSLKDIVLLLQRATAQVGEDKLSVRTKFMMETINNLKNNRMKTGVAASAITAEHTTRMKRTLGSLNTRGSAIKATEPLRISLADIRDSEKKGKWWLVGASYHDPAKLASTKPSKAKTDIDDGYESETPGHVSLTKLAKSQGMNTDIRRAIFISILSATDFQDAHFKLLKLHLKNKQQLEIPRVLLHCAGAEKVYNPYYTLIARKLCGERRLRKGWQFALWDVLRRVGGEEEGEEEQMTTGKIVNLAKLFGSLIADGGLSIACLRVLDFAFLQARTRMFVEVLLTTVLLQASKSTAGYESTVQEVFTQAATAEGLLQGLRYFLESTVSKAEIAATKKERRVVREGCEHAIQALAVAKEKGPVVMGNDDEDAGGMSD